MNSGSRAAEAEDARHVLKNQAGVQCEVVVPREAGPVALFAGRELQRFLAQAFAGDVALLMEPSGERTALVLGRSAHLRQAGIDVNALPRDGFAVKSFDGGVLIAGRYDLRTRPEQPAGTQTEYAI